MFVSPIPELFHESITVSQFILLLEDKNVVSSDYYLPSAANLQFLV